MTPTQLKRICKKFPSGQTGLAKSLKVARSWVQRRLTGETAIKQKDELAILAVARPAERLKALDRGEGEVERGSGGL